MSDSVSVHESHQTSYPARLSATGSGCCVCRVYPGRSVRSDRTLLRRSRESILEFSLAVRPDAGAPSARGGRSRGGVRVGVDGRGEAMVAFCKFFANGGLSAWSAAFDAEVAEDLAEGCRFQRQAGWRAGFRVTLHQRPQWQSDSAGKAGIFLPTCPMVEEAKESDD